MATALITGPTAGIGLALTRQLAAEGSNLVLVSRDQARLEQLAEQLRAEFGVECEVLAADLSVRADSLRVEQRLADDARPIDVLVNNAGFGLNDGFRRSSIDDEQRLLDVLVGAVMRLSHAAVPGMVKRGHGEILNVSSVAAWIAMGTYSAAKAWVTVFSESLRTELKGTGVRVTALAPGFTHTEFHERAAIEMSTMPEWMWLDADRVARDALRDLRKGKAISVPGPQYKGLATLVQVLPRPLVRRATAAGPRQPRR